MKTKKMITDEGGGCVNELKLSRKKNQRAIISCNFAPVEFGLYKLLRLRDWVEGTIAEIEAEVAAKKQMKNNSVNSVSSVAKKK